MCGRFAITLPPDAMRRLFAYEDQPNFPPRYNIAPTQPVPTIRALRGERGLRRRFALCRWAFLPSFAKAPADFPLLFNARAEGVRDKASFRNAIRRRRCLIPADAFYEWQRWGSGKTARAQPFLCQRSDGTTMALAGLWETWMGPNGEEVDTACIVTTGANGVSAAIHPRLPVVVEPDSFAVWLDPEEASLDAALRLLRPPDDDVLRFTPIGDGVNKVANDGPEVQAAIGPALSGAANRFAQRSPPEAEQPSLF